LKKLYETIFFNLIAETFPQTLSHFPAKQLSWWL